MKLICTMLSYYTYITLLINTLAFAYRAVIYSMVYYYCMRIECVFFTSGSAPTCILSTNALC